MTHPGSSVSPSGFSILKLIAASLCKHVSLWRFKEPTCGPAVGLADMPPDVIRAVLAAAGPHEAAAAAALAATCHRMRRLMSFCTTAANMQLFGRSQQLTPLLQGRLMGACWNIADACQPSIPRSITSRIDVKSTPTSSCRGPTTWTG
jgi:hypothetical protein